MSKTAKDILILGGAAGSVALLAAGAELSVPVLGAAAAALAAGAAVAKIVDSHAEAQSALKRQQEQSRQVVGCR